MIILYFGGFVAFILNMSVQICRATQSFHSLKRRAPLPSRSAASNSALVGASMPTYRGGNDCETVQKCNAMQCNAMQKCSAIQCNLMQCNAMQCNLMQCNAIQCPALKGIFAPTSVRRSRYFSCKRITILGGLQIFYSQTDASTNEDLSTSRPYNNNNRPHLEKINKPHISPPPAR